MNNILGLDLGTNSIGWAVIAATPKDVNEGIALIPQQIKCAGSRILPMDAAILGDFDKGNTVSQTASRTAFRGVRRLIERGLLRRQRLHRVLDVLGFLPDHYASSLDRFGKFITPSACKLPWITDESGKSRFLFMDSFHEMLSEFYRHHPELERGEKKIPYDWTLYYLRKKALSGPIAKEELAWILLNFNQKRGYYQLRGEDDVADTKKEEYLALKVVRVADSGEKKGKDSWYNVYLENGMIYRRASSEPLKWEGMIKDFIVTTELNSDGTEKLDRNGEVKRSFRAPKEEDWTLVKKKTEADIAQSHLTVGSYIYNTLLEKPEQKIRGGLVRTIERKYYKEELRQILEVQTKYHQELQNNDLYQSCISTLYHHNEAHRAMLATKRFVHLFIDDLLFYQRPLKSKKSLIADCPYETHTYIDKTTGEEKKASIKCIAKSHPLYQEFRLWQFLSNLRIYQLEGSVVKNGVSCRATDIDVTSDFLSSPEAYVALFDWMNVRKEVDQKSFLACPLLKLKPNERGDYRWNYVQENKVYPCNETRALLLTALHRAGVNADFLTVEVELRLWHLLYSVEDKQELHRALETFARKNGLSTSFVEVFAKLPPFKKDYGAYSAKALKKLLPLMRNGSYWNEAAIDENTRTRIAHLITGEWDETIRMRVREKAIHLTMLNDFKGLPLWLACYIVYDRHSEAKEVTKWEQPEDIDAFLHSFKQYSLRNPIVEQVVTETLRTVRDIWKQEGHIDEIHIELGRTLKNPADVRARITQQQYENEATNMRIKRLLAAFIDPEYGIENVLPYSPSQQELLKIYEEGVFNREEDVPDDITAILKKFNQTDVKKQPTHGEFIRYKLWLDQKYCSPYTGAFIPLGKLFTSAYEIEHIIPRARYFDDSLSNKVICESEVNKLKGSLLGHEFIKEHHGRKVELGHGKTVELFSVEAYEDFVERNYRKNRGKMKKLLMDDVPEAFIERQLNDSRYISKLIKTLLSNVVRDKDEQEDISKHIVTCVGQVTDRLKNDWGINDQWNKVILSRFVRMNQLTNTGQFTTLNTNGTLIPAMPLEYQNGFNKKRIDHRHHAMDAIVIACASRNIVNYLNNESASKHAKLSRLDLQRQLCHKQKTDGNGNSQWVVNQPWERFPVDVLNVLQNIIVTFKQNLRVINKTENRTLHFENGKKVYIKQTKGEHWAIRKPMHKETVFGEVNLRKVKVLSLEKAVEQIERIVEKDLKHKIKELQTKGYSVKQMKEYFKTHEEEWRDINVAKIPVYYFTKETNDRYFATRKSIDVSFKADKIRESVTDTGAQRILLNHLAAYENNPERAFSPEGIDAMNRNLLALNGGKAHQPLYKVRVYEKAEKFAVGEVGNKQSKFVEAAKGTNLFFAVYETPVNDESGTITYKRSYASIPLNEVIARQKKGLTIVPKEEGAKTLKFILSPNDLVYLPTAEELTSKIEPERLDKDRIYKMVSSTGNRCFFIPERVAKTIVDKLEYFALNKIEIVPEYGKITEHCRKLICDRLGNVLKIE